MKRETIGDIAYAITVMVGILAIIGRIIEIACKYA